MIDSGSIALPGFSFACVRDARVERGGFPDFADSHTIDPPSLRSLCLMDPWAYHSDEEDEDADAVPDAPPTQIMAGAAERSPGMQEAAEIPLPAASVLVSLRVAELKSLLRSRNRAVSGRKAALIARLLGEPEPESAGRGRAPQPPKRKAQGKAAIFSSSDDEDEEKKTTAGNAEDEEMSDEDDEGRGAHQDRQECVLM